MPEDQLRMWRWLVAVTLCLLALSSIINTLRLAHERHRIDDLVTQVKILREES